MMQSNAKFYIKSTIASTATVGGTFLLSKDIELNADLETGTESVSMVLKNGTQIERFEITATAGTGTIVKRGLTQAGTSTASVGLQKQWQDGTLAYVTALAFDIVDKQGDTMTGSLKFSGTTHEGIVPISLTTSQRTALTPTGPALVYDTTLSELYQYIGGSWSAVSSGSTQPNASATVAGKVEIGTQGEVDSVTDTGGTGAYVVVIPSTLDTKIMKQTSLVNGGITGEVKMWTTAVAPTNWLICDGASLLRAGTYASLFAVIGTTYGTADGTHFNIPDFRGRSPIGAGTGTATGATAHTLGTTPTSGAGGEEKHTLITAEMPAHTHTMTYNASSGAVPQIQPVSTNAAGTATVITSSSTGGDTGHNIMSPNTAINFIIRI